MLAGGALTLALALVTAQGPHAAAAKRKKHATPPAPSAVTSERRVQAPPRASSPPAPSAKQRAESDTTSTDSGGGDATLPDTAARPRAAKTKVYTFGAMDVEGKLKTPQLLYFLNRVKLELEMSAPDHRSFMKELEQTADDPNL